MARLDRNYYPPPFFYLPENERSSFPRPAGRHAAICTGLQCCAGREGCGVGLPSRRQGYFETRPYASVRLPFPFLSLSSLPALRHCGRKWRSGRHAARQYLLRDAILRRKRKGVHTENRHNSQIGRLKKAKTKKHEIDVDKLLTGAKLSLKKYFAPMRTYTSSPRFRVMTRYSFLGVEGVHTIDRSRSATCVSHGP